MPPVDHELQYDARAPHNRCIYSFNDNKYYSPESLTFGGDGDLPVKWLARVRCVMFWSKVLTSRTYDGRLLRRIAVEAVRFGRGSWFGKMSVCWGQFG